MLQLVFPPILNQYVINNCEINFFSSNYGLGSVNVELFQKKSRLPYLFNLLQRVKYGQKLVAWHHIIAANINHISLPGALWILTLVLPPWT